MSEKPVDQDNPAVGQTSDTYNDEAVMLVGKMRNHGNYTVGTLLTTVEAALGDSAQAEAVKAIVRREMYMLIDRSQAEVYEYFKMQKPGLAPPEKYIDGQDSLKNTKE